MSREPLEVGQHPSEDYVDVDWAALVALPFDEWEHAQHTPALTACVQKLCKMKWSLDDEHFSQPHYTTAIMRLLRLISVHFQLNLERLQREKEDLETSASAARNAEDAVRAHVELLRSENNELRALMEKKGFNEGEAKEAVSSLHQDSGTEKRHSREKLAKSARELDSLRQENNELCHVIKRLNAEKRHIVSEDKKFRLEYEHLVAKHKRLIENAKKTDEMLRELQRSEEVRGRDEEGELHRLRHRVRTLQQENYNLLQSRDRAEELCERREAEALRDMTELQQLHQDIVEEEKQHSQELAMELEKVQKESQKRMEESVQGLQQSLKKLEEENSTLRKRLERRFVAGHRSERDTTEDSATVVQNLLSGSTSVLSVLPNVSPYSKLEPGNRTRQKLFADRQQLQQENDRLAAELQQMEIRAEARDAEVIKIQHLLSEYERGNEGLRRLRGELADANRSIELFQDENAQLRERLNAMEDSLTFSAALQELCIRIGVTQEEIDRLRPKNTPLFSEVETLREEVATLKDEVEWLEKERRHWMDKVRLQPLLDTKLRLELGLSPEQLKQLDHMVDQMRSGRLVVEEDGDDNYKEKYFHELQLRRKEMEHFNDFVRHRIEEALREALGKTDLNSAPDAASALHTLRERFDFIAARPLMDSAQEPPLDAAQLRMQLRSAAQLLEQSELTIKDNAACQAVLREQLAAVTAERDMLIDERDRYRTAVFEALGVTPSAVPTVERREANAETLATPSEAAPVSGVASEAPPSPVLPEMQKNNVHAARAVPLGAISRTFEEQLRVKDGLIASLKAAIEAARKEAAEHQAAEVKATERLSEVSAAREDLRNQVAAIQQMNEELSGKLEEKTRLLEDLQQTVQHLESDNTRQLLQKIVLLRQREGKLLERLRRVRETQEEAVRSEQTLREYVNTTFKSLKEALEDTSTGFVLPRSSGGVCVENDLLDDVRQRLDGALRGKLFKEDSAYLLQLRQVYRSVEHAEEENALRVDEKRRRKQVEEMEQEISELRTELEGLRKVREAAPGTQGGDASQAARWETEATTWRQKCSLYMKRCEDREREVSTLEAEIAETREELALLQEHLHNSGGGSRGDAMACVTRSVGALPQERQQQQQQPTQEEHVEGPSPPPPSSSSSSSSPPQKQQLQLQQQPEMKQVVHGITADGKLRQLERDVARLKSINLGLLHHSLDLQGECKRLEIQLESTKQELSLVRDAGDSRKVSDFVSAAIQQHAALRRQSELALLRAKRSRMQLSATEANLRVAVNEATAYRLSAFRLYRTYVSQMVAVLDYVRGRQRDTKGAMSPHRVAMMHQRFINAMTDLERSQSQQQEMAARLAESGGMVTLLQQQLDLLNTKDAEEREDALHAKLLSSLAAVREKDMQLVELQEDYQYAQQKLKRAESHIRQLNEELTRLELRATGGVSLNEDILQRLLQLKETVFAKVESPALVVQSGGLQDVADRGTDAAIREYKTALDKQAELARECSSLKKRLDGETAEAQRARAEAESLKEELNRLQERLQYTQRQLEEERQKAEERERRIIRSHEAQAEVTRRAAEHNSHCLQDMLQNKEACIKQLQDQLQVERRKYLEYQLEESSRMERLHDHLFRENNAMMERFREAIDGVTDNSAYDPAAQGASVSDASPDGLAAQLALLTKETLRLKAELKDARMTNVMLEAQLNDQVAKAQNQLLQQESTHGGKQVAQRELPGEASVVGVIADQNAIIESLRQREFTLTSELQRYRNERDLMERQLHEARQLVVEQGGALKSVTAVGVTDPSVEQELRVQLAFVESQLSETRAQLEEERQSARRLQADTSQWRSHLDALREEVVQQQADVERARHLVAMNEGLNADVRRMEEQNEKLILATKMLKEKLIEQAQRHGDDSRRQQHEIALAQRMGSIQLESTEQLRAVNERLHTIQRELEGKVLREEEALRKHEEAQRVAYDLHRQLQEREREILRLKRELAARPASSSTGVRGGGAEGTQELQTAQEGRRVLPGKAVGSRTSPQLEGAGKRDDDKPQSRPAQRSPSAPTRGLLVDVDANVLARPQIAAMLRREIDKAQRDNMHDISSLRADVRRLESDLEEARQQLRGERDTSRSLRVMVQNARRELEEKELAMARESVGQQRRAKERQEVESKSGTGSSKPPATDSAVVVAPMPATAAASEQGELRRQREENEQLRRQVERLKKRVVAFDSVVAEAEVYKKELADLRSQQLESVDAAHMASPLDVRSYKRNVLQLEGVIDSLRRELSVNKETQLRNLQRRADELAAENQRLTAELGSRHQLMPTPQLPTTSSGAENLGDRAALERELLEKNGIILDLRFEREALQLKAGRLERHIEDILRVDSTNTKRTGTFQQRSRVEALESVVENLKLVVERLQKENKVLKTKTVSLSKHMDLVRELRELRLSEQKLREHAEMLTKRLLGSAPSGSAMSRQHVTLQRRLQTAQATMEQYEAEVLELKQRLDERQGVVEAEEVMPSGQKEPESTPAWEDRRMVQPVQAWSSDLPPPLPNPPVTFTAGLPSGHHTYPRA
ncbi:kinesin K39 [Trypanosoma conorhini]|uniref:Kinesin K39 n=1 Tax=Trypanosoma conorhini TaxID=83891 RepID=A0A422NZR5_9TRYP|nr:kinesin K39 [Trypanosoma conorhini]RNF10931.1 kinesin K39 [Trypanosoma conorhini]